ncbi:MAG: hypothetical protein E6640_01640 [Actinomyces urogenitalis]|uniref:hypothetical protein n=1 Tax=Actinomyces urogenitalis TaxID=103621 RepID=UPI00290915D8|nr:hypothetical protein [Actinomyces urogenitalis]MDU6150913.1 hypothetical protein [Actinomyces urogenitalis]
MTSDRPRDHAGRFTAHRAADPVGVLGPVRVADLIGLMRRDPARAATHPPAIALYRAIRAPYNR